MINGEKLAFSMLYCKHEKIILMKERKKIEGYEQIIYELLKLAMYKNFKRTKITNDKLKKIKEYCNLVSNFKDLPSEIIDAIKLIEKDYEYLNITENIDYFFKDYYELMDKVEFSTNIYMDDIMEDVKCCLKEIKKDKEKIKKYIMILENKENVLDTNMIYILKNAIG